MSFDVTLSLCQILLSSCYVDVALCTSAKVVLFLCLVCEQHEWISMRSGGQIGTGPRSKELDFGVI